jgi:dipeptidase D
MEVLEAFEELVKVPRCSGNHQPFLEWITNMAIRYGYSIKFDNAKNVLISRGEPTICLQAHYDIVCIGDASSIEMYEEDGFLKAKDHTLGADNGIAIAYIIALMGRGYEFEALLTSDEEIGLIGANELELSIKSNYILNLDTEEEGYIYIGCAGGINFDGFIDFESVDIDKNENLYQIEVSGLCGGHSGVDIDKDIDNAIVLLVEELSKYNLSLISIDGGQRDNSIPTSAKAIVSSYEELPFQKIEQNQSYKKIANSKDIINFLQKIKTGVLSKDSDMVLTSQNFAIINTVENKISLIVSQRAMSNSELKSINQNLCELFAENGFEYSVNSKYPAWKPTVNEFTTFVKKVYSKLFDEVSFKTIHAGLECGVLLQKFPNRFIASIGPNIYNPHSIHEKVEIASIEKLFAVVENIIHNQDLLD